MNQHFILACTTNPSAATILRQEPLVLNKTLNRLKILFYIAQLLQMGKHCHLNAICYRLTTSWVYSWHT